MSSSTFTPSATVDLSKEKDWQANLGMLDWDSTSVVFTKRTLIEFLKYAGITVDPSFTNIAKLPRYAKFGKLTASPVTSDAVTAKASDEGLEPSHGARDQPGTKHTDIFAADPEDDALAQAPPKLTDDASNSAPIAPVTKTEVPDEPYRPEFKPTRRVNARPGGKDTVANLWDDNYTEEFKPTRRVKHGPGGHDQITGIF